MFTIRHFTGEGEKPATECAPVQASKQFLRGLFSLDRLLEELVEMRKVYVSGDTGSAEELLESLEYVEGMLDDIVESSPLESEWDHAILLIINFLSPNKTTASEFSYRPVSF
jgi:hypothetical protein